MLAAGATSAAAETPEFKGWRIGETYAEAAKVVPLICDAIEPTQAATGTTRTAQERTSVSAALAARRCVTKKPIIVGTIPSRLAELQFYGDVLHYIRIDLDWRPRTKDEYDTRNARYVADMALLLEALKLKLSPAYFSKDPPMRRASGSTYRWEMPDWKAEFSLQLFSGTDRSKIWVRSSDYEALFRAESDVRDRKQRDRAAEKENAKAKELLERATQLKQKL